MNIHYLAQQVQFDSQGSSMGPIVGILYLAIVILYIASMWKVFTKAGQPGWASIIPIYNIVVLFQIAGKPLWWILLMLVPIANIIVMFLVLLEVANRFGKGAGFGIGLIFFGFIFWPILGFGDAHYQAAGPVS